MQSREKSCFVWSDSSNSHWVIPTCSDPSDYSYSIITATGSHGINNAWAQKMTWRGMTDMQRGLWKHPQANWLPPPSVYGLLEWMRCCQAGSQLCLNQTQSSVRQDSQELPLSSIINPLTLFVWYEIVMISHAKGIPLQTTRSCSPFRSTSLRLLSFPALIRHHTKKFP